MDKLFLLILAIAAIIVGTAFVYTGIVFYREYRHKRRLADSWRAPGSRA